MKSFRKRLATTSPTGCATRSAGNATGKSGTSGSGTAARIPTASWSRLSSAGRSGRTRNRSWRRWWKRFAGYRTWAPKGTPPWSRRPSGWCWRRRRRRTSLLVLEKQEEEKVFLRPEVDNAVLWNAVEMVLRHNVASKKDTSIWKYDPNYVQIENYIEFARNLFSHDFIVEK